MTKRRKTQQPRISQEWKKPAPEPAMTTDDFLDTGEGYIEAMTADYRAIRAQMASDADALGMFASLMRESITPQAYLPLLAFAVKLRADEQPDDPSE